ncbi:MAG: hypothetical protein C5B53_06605 [Candidatus Melainabacteria bacterium]|nr:MAG: hypothetical protein C5B53_06605 [Candidatus Melainabacteria bacterium]
MFIRLRSAKLVFAVALVTTFLAQLVFSAASFAAHGGIFGSKHTPIRQNAFINVKSNPYNARGDGSTDDTASLQRAANDALAQGKYVFFPAGTYLHAGAISFNSVAVRGVGTQSMLLANNGANSAIELTGSNPSIQNMTISTQGITEGGTPSLTGGNLVVANANGFTVAADTLVQGQAEIAIYVFNSSSGVINGVVFDGTGSAGDTGVLLNMAGNVSIIGNLFQNEDIGVGGSASQSIAVISNAIGNASFPTRSVGVDLFGIHPLSVSQNAIQMAVASTNAPPAPIAISLTDDDAIQVSQNSIAAGSVGVYVTRAGISGNTISQNVIGGSGGGLTGPAVILNNGSAPTEISVNANIIGECGLLPNGPPTSDAIVLVQGDPSSGNTTFIQNNSYQGHTNVLFFYISSTFHIPSGNVTGNAQTQTVLPNNIP